MELDYIIQQVLVTLQPFLIEIPIEYEEQIRG